MPTMKFRTAILRLKAIDINLNYCYTSIIFSVFFVLIGMNFLICINTRLITTAL